jgi:hypothetical protein
MAKTAHKAAPKKAAVKKPVPATSGQRQKKNTGDLPQATEYRVMMVEDMEPGEWEQLQEWCGANNVFCATHLINFKTAIPYEVYEQWHQSKEG